MSDIGKNALKTKIDNKVYENSSQAITGTIMNEVLQDMVDTLADGGNLDAGSVNTANIADGAVTDAKLQNPVSVSQNTLSIGGNYAGEMSTTYDVTLHNNGATFASLESLLSDANLDTLIPLTVRKGGMSIKFVQSSDNKYVQYRLVADSFSANDADWYNDTDYNIGRNLSSNGTTFTTKSSARSLIPASERFTGMELTYVLNGSWITEKYTGDATDATEWVYGTWKTIGVYLNNINISNGEPNPFPSRFNARQRVQSDLKSNCYGLIITYLLHDAKGFYWRREQCISSEFGDADSKWELLSTYDMQYSLNLEEVVNSNISFTQGQSTRTTSFSLQQGKYTIRLHNGSGRIAFCNSSWGLIMDCICSEDTPVTIDLFEDCYNLQIDLDNPAASAKDVGLYIIKDSIRTELRTIARSLSDVRQATALKNGRYKIASGSNNVNIYESHNFASPVRGSIKVSGIDCIVYFLNASYGTISQVTVYDGVIKDVVIPAGYKNLYIKTIDGSPVSSDTYFRVELIYGTIMNYISQSIDNLKRGEEGVLYDQDFTISSGEYRKIIQNLTAFEAAKNGKLKLSGLDAFVEFDTSTWRTIDTYYAYNDVEREIILPKRCPNIIIYTKDKIPVSETVTGHIKVEYSDSIDGAILLESLMDRNKYLPVLQNLKRTAIGSGGVPSETYSTLSLASLTDIHNDVMAMTPIMRMLNFYNAYIDDIIGLGDYYDTHLVPTLDVASIYGWNRVIKAIGNHDAYTGWSGGSPTGYATEQECYDAVLKDDIASWGVEYTQNKTYFYKDYEKANIRVIFLDYMHWDDENDTDGQKAWLIDILYGDNVNSAAAKGLNVVICEHVVPTSSLSGGIVRFENCTFENLDRVPSTSENVCTVPDIVNEFITNHNGVFVCHLFGHSHICFTGTYENYQNQILICQPCVLNANDWRDSALGRDTDYLMQFFMISFDAEKKYIRVYKVGANYNRNMQHQEAMCLQYGDTIKLLSCY